MRKVFTVIGLIIVFLLIYFLQVNIFSSFTIAGVKPNLFVIYVLFIGLFANQFVGISLGVVFGIILDLLYGSTLVLNVGTNDGIRENMTVIADKGLVGHVISVTENTCKVQVIIDSASTVSCSISTTNESIICKGTLENDQILRASYIPTGAELIQGDSVYTSGIGGIYPKGIVIGNVKEIITTSNITDRYAIVEPAVDFSKIDTVLIINE